jgi:hypothetical protein
MAFELLQLYVKQAYWTRNHENIVKCMLVEIDTSQKKGQQNIMGLVVGNATAQTRRILRH